MKLCVRMSDISDGDSGQEPQQDHRQKITEVLGRNRLIQDNINNNNIHANAKVKHEGGRSRSKQEKDNSRHFKYSQNDIGKFLLFLNVSGNKTVEKEEMGLAEENLLLRRHLRKQEEKIKLLATKLVRIVGEKRNKVSDK